MTATWEQILETKKEEVRARCAEQSIGRMQKLACEASSPRDFAGALRAAAEAMVEGGGGESRPFPLIAEIKRKSPSKERLLEDPDAINPAERAKDYERGGAACLSVLTDEPYFGGNEEHLRVARDACSLPVLRKDFMIDEWQIYESRAMGADAVLLIAAALKPGQLQDMAKLAMDLGMAVLTESRTEEELNESMKVEDALIGINNRDLQGSFETSPDATTKLAPLANDRFAVSESGIKSATDIARLRKAGAKAFLIGEALMKAKDPAEEIPRLFAA